MMQEDISHKQLNKKKIFKLEIREKLKGRIIVQNLHYHKCRRENFYQIIEKALIWKIIGSRIIFFESFFKINYKIICINYSIITLVQ